MNEQQRAAVNAPNGYVQIIAGPGTGKTFALVHRIVELLKRGLEPSRIVVVTFTRAAAREVLDRVNAATNSKTRIIIGTFHSVALRLLRRYGGDDYRSIGIIDELEKADILRTIADVDGANAHKIASEISRIKSRHDDAPMCDEAMYEILEQYDERLRLLNKTDFDGLLRLFLHFLQTSDKVQNAVDAVLVDEFQDTSLLQLDIALLMAERCGNLTVVGDPDQSIYGFRNADMRNFVRMAERHPTQRWYLEKNYRSEQAILSAATRVIERSEERYAGDRQLVANRETSNAEVQFIQLMSPQDEAQNIVASMRFLISCGIRRDEICVLSRYTSTFQHLETAMLSAAIPNRIIGGKRLSERKEVRLIIDYMRVVLDDNNALAIERTVNRPRRGLGDKTLSRVRDVNGLLSLKSIRAIGSEQSRSYTRIIDAARKILAPLPKDDIAGATKQALAIVNAVSSRVLNAQTTTPSVGGTAAVDFIDSALQQFQPIYEDSEEDDDRSFLQAFLDQWALGTDAQDGKPSAEEDDQGKVTLCTIHSAKGLEWPVVYMIDVSAGAAHFAGDRDPDEERRLLYVAMTRAKSLLIASTADATDGFDELLNVPSHLIKHEVRMPDMKSLSLCVGRELEERVMVPRRSVLASSVRFDAKAPVELPPGFQLASELHQPSNRPPQNRPWAKPISTSPTSARTSKVSKKVPNNVGKTLLSFWGAPAKK